MFLVTGASGLLGQHLLEALSSTGKKIRAVYKTKIPTIYTKLKSQQIEWVQCDLLDTPALEKVFEGITHVYHCAAIVSYDPRMCDDMMEINIEGTANIVNFCLEKKINKLCYVSSIATIGEGMPGQLVTEKDDWEEKNENSNYAISKQGAEMEVWRGIAEGLNAVIINPGIILGEGDDTRSSTNLFKIVYDEFPYFTKGVTSWVDVKDVVNIMIKLMNSDIHNERFIVSEGNYAYRTIFTKMAIAMNKKPPHKEASQWMTELAWRFYYLKSLLNGKTATITQETARSAQAKKEFDNSKLLNALPDFKYTPIEESILRICSKYRKD